MNLRPLITPVDAEFPQQNLREGKQAGLLALALLDMDQHAGAVDVLGPERDGLRDPEQG